MKPSSESRSGRPAASLWITLTVAGLVLRVMLIPISPKYGYFGDHDDFVRWGMQAAEEGVLSLYDHPPARRTITVWDKQGAKWLRFERTVDRLCNYPPGSGYLLWVSGVAFRAMSDDGLINTPVSRACFSIWSIAADILLAWGCASLVGLYRPGRASLWTYGIVLGAPPIWWDSVVWGQMDSVVLAPAVWMLRAMVANRWVTAGILLGVTGALKPQAVLFAPVWGLAVVSARPFFKPILAGVLAACVFLLVGLPFTLHSGWTWLASSYVENLLHAYKQTTLKAFNLWYVDLLLSGSLDATATWWGVSKDSWGRGLLLVGLTAGFVWMLWRWRRDPRGLIPWTMLTLLCFVMLPTRVHERYLVLVIPFLIVCAMLWYRFWPGLVMLLIVATSQVTWPVWMTTGPGRWDEIRLRVEAGYQQAMAKAPPAQRANAPPLESVLRDARRHYDKQRAETLAYEWFVTILALIAMPAIVIALASLDLPRARRPLEGKLLR